MLSSPPQSGRSGLRRHARPHEPASVQLFGLPQAGAVVRVRVQPRVGHQARPQNTSRIPEIAHKPRVSARVATTVEGRSTCVKQGSATASRGPKPIQNHTRMTPMQGCGAVRIKRPAHWSWIQDVDFHLELTHRARRSRIAWKSTVLGVRPRSHRALLPMVVAGSESQTIGVVRRPSFRRRLLRRAVGWPDVIRARSYTVTTGWSRFQLGRGLGIESV